MTDIKDTLAGLSAEATPGEWEVDSEYDNDALYSGGCGCGFKNFFIGAEVGGKWQTLLDTVNSDHKLVEDDFDEDGKTSWDEIGRKNTAFIVALVNAYRSGQLVPVPSVEMVARVICETSGDDWLREGPEGLIDGPYMLIATAVIAAMTGGPDHA